MQKLQNETTQAVTIDESAPAIPSQNTFYQESSLLLCITLPLVAIGMDLAAGLALREARVLVHNAPTSAQSFAKNSIWSTSNSF
jgi:hypothetical protein